MTSPAKVRLMVDGRVVANLLGEPVSGKTIAIEVDADPAEGKPQLTVRYELSDSSNHLTVDTIYRNPSAKEVSDDLGDSIRADRTFTFQFDSTTHCYFADDEWFRQAYGVSVDG